MSIQISGGGASVQDIQSGLATAVALAALATSVAGREQQVSANAPNHIAVNVDMSSATWNTVGTHEVFTVTGVVRMRLWVVCVESPSGDGSVSLKDENTTWFQATSIDEITHGTFILNGAGAMASSATSDVVADIMCYDVDFGLSVIGYAMTGGTLIVHCVWEPLSAGATVVAGTGGPL